MKTVFEQFSTLPDVFHFLWHFCIYLTVSEDREGKGEGRETTQGPWTLHLPYVEGTLTIQLLVQHDSSAQFETKTSSEVSVNNARCLRN